MVIFNSIFATDKVFYKFLGNLERVSNQPLVEWPEFLLLVVITNAFFTFLMEPSEQQYSNLVNRLLVKQQARA